MKRIKLIDRVSKLLKGNSRSELICKKCNSTLVRKDGVCKVCSGWTEHEAVSHYRKTVLYDNIDLSLKYLETTYGCYLPYSYEEHNYLLIRGIYKAIVDCPYDKENGVLDPQREHKACKYCGKSISKYGCVNCDPLAKTKYYEAFVLNELEKALLLIKNGDPFTPDIKYILDIVHFDGSNKYLNRFINKEIEYTIVSIKAAEPSKKSSYEEYENMFLYAIVVDGVEYTISKRILSKAEQDQQVIDAIKKIRKNLNKKWHVVSSDMLKIRIHELQSWCNQLEIMQRKFFTSRGENLRISRQIKVIRKRVDQMQSDLSYLDNNVYKMKKHFYTRVYNTKFAS